MVRLSALQLYEKLHLKWSVIDEMTLRVTQGHPNGISLAQDEAQPVVSSGIEFHANVAVNLVTSDQKVIAIYLSLIHI